MMVLGCGDGSVRLFDRRLSSAEAKIMTYREHNAWVLGAYFRKYTSSSITLITGSSFGDIRFFDIRKNSSVNIIQTTQGITNFVMHETADIFAR
jgi:regulator-associated protein of mTOR